MASIPSPNPNPNYSFLLYNTPTTNQYFLCLKPNKTYQLNPFQESKLHPLIT